MKKDLRKWEINLSNGNWFRTTNISVCGYIYTQDDEFLTGMEMCQYLDVLDTQLFLDRLKSSNGLYSVVYHSEKIQMAVVDPSRIYPLYYRKSENGVFLSDYP